MIANKPMKKVPLSLDPDDYYRFQAIVPKGDASKAIRLLIAEYLRGVERRYYEQLGRKHEMDSLPEIELTAKELEMTGQ